MSGTVVETAGPGLDALFAPRRIAVVGASTEPAKLGSAMARALAGYGPGALLVNQRAPDGMYPTVVAAAQATGEPVDLAVLCVPAPACAAAVADAADAGAGAVLVCAGGFSEAGEAGRQAEADLLAVARARRVRVLGPNTSGFAVPATGLVASFVPAARTLPAGSVAVVAASGGVNHALAFDLVAAGNGLSRAVGIGGGIDVTAADVLRDVISDPSTRAVALHVETVPDGPALLGAVAELSAVKPVVALVVGRSDVGDFARSHTGALATSWRTTRAVLRQAGAVVVDDERELVDAVTALSRIRLAPRLEPGVGVVTAQAGPGLLLTDALRAGGVAVPELAETTVSRLGEHLPPLTYQRNPVDTGRPGPTFGAVLSAVGADPGVDLLVTYALVEPDALDLPAALGSTDVPAVVATGGPAAEVAGIRERLHARGIPVLPSPTAAANAVRALVRDAESRAVRLRVGGAVSLGSGAVPGGLDLELGAFDPVSGALDEAAAKGVLDRLGIVTPRRRVCAGREEAHAARAELGGPVVVKRLDATVLHKSDVGGVHVGIRSADELDAALDAIGPSAYLVEDMAGDGVELMVGARRDPVFGPIVVLGLGGTAANVVADVTVRAAPLREAEAATMLDELAGAALVRGHRGGPTLDEQELARVVAVLGTALVASPGIDEIEVNPLRVTARGLIALDAVILGSGGGSADDH